jgi:hypothetical protein
LANGASAWRNARSPGAVIPSSFVRRICFN